RGENGKAEAGGAARRSFLARGDSCRRGGSEIWGDRGRGEGRGGRVLRAHDPAQGRAKLADAHECRPSTRPAEGLLRSSRRSRARQRQERHLRHAERDGAHSSERWRYRLLVLAPAREGIDGPLDDRGREWSNLFHEALV